MEDRKFWKINLTNLRKTGSRTVKNEDIWQRRVTIPIWNLFPLALCKESCSTWLGNETKVFERPGSENTREHNKEIKEKRTIWKPIGAKKGGKKGTL